jgi:hypothetical protein
MTDTRVLLCMIVRNEAAIISRCLQAAGAHDPRNIAARTASPRYRGTTFCSRLVG